MSRSQTQDRLAGRTVDQDLDRGFETEMADAAVEGLVDARLRPQPIPVHPSLMSCVDCEEGHSEAGEIVEEVGAEGRFDLEIAEVGFDDGAGARDLRPLDRDAQPGITGTPPTRAR